jgi:hypothetical protein
LIADVSLSARAAIAISRPASTNNLSNVLLMATLRKRKDTVFMTGSQIADWFVAANNASRKHGKRV